MILDFYRVVPWSAEDSLEPAALLVPSRELQGRSRHDNTDLYTALYCSTTRSSAVSELVQNLGSELDDKDLFRSGKRLHLVHFSTNRDLAILDADDPSMLTSLRTRPSRFASRFRENTQPIARHIFESGKDGFLWWSTIEASWINATLFAERVISDIDLRGAPRPLTIDSGDVRSALSRQ